MSRETKFRGKRLGDGGWVYGYLVSGDYQPKMTNYTRTWIMHFGRLQGALKKAEVYPTTVGQFTGLTDKNGVEIYKGDILTGYVNDYPIEVTWELSSGGWYTNNNRDDEYGHSGTLSIGVANNTEVIGNIYDNPELAP